MKDEKEAERQVCVDCICKNDHILLWHKFLQENRELIVM